MAMTSGWRLKAWSSGHAWYLRLAPVIILGLLLRLYLLPDQVLIDDEWQALTYAADRPLLYLLTHQGGGANCVPQNVYSFIVLHTAGWSEMLLRLPSIIAGVLGLLVFPVMIRMIWDDSVALIFTCFLAVAPCAIFYSRFCRPYAMVMFCGTLALLSMFLWIRTARRRWMFVYALSAFAAAYCHLYATLFVLPPLFCLAGARILKDHGWGKASLPPIRQLFQAAGVVFVLTSLFIIPPNVLNPWWLNGEGFHGYGGATRRTLLDLFSLVSGTYAPTLQILFLASAAMGLFLTMREAGLIGAMILAGLLSFTVKVVTSEQFGMDVAIQVARYGIVLFPISFLLAAIALARGLRKAPHDLRAIAVIGITAAYLIYGPLRAIYRSPNNFTNHSAFQYHYDPIDWRVSRDRGFFGLVLKEANIPAAYAEVVSKADTAGVIEYPLLVGDDFDPYYYYQLFHRKRVAIGYFPDVLYSPMIFEGKADEGIKGDTTAGYVLHRVPEKLREKVHFRNLVALSDAARLKRLFSRWDIIIHHQLLNEMYPDRVKRGAGKNEYVRGAIRRLNASGMQTVYGDDQLTILRIP